MSFTGDSSMQFIMTQPILIQLWYRYYSPILADVLNDAQKKTAKQYILKLINQDPIMTDDENMSQDESRGDNGSIDEPNEPSPSSPKRFKHFKCFIGIKQKGKDQQNEGMSSFETELDRYITTPSAQSMEDDPFEFWLQNMTVFPNLSVNISLREGTFLIAYPYYSRFYGI